jgi:hypothetical protein
MYNDKFKSKSLQSPPAGAVVQWPLANNSILSQTGQPIPPYPNNCYNQFHTPYYPLYPGYGASIFVTLFSENTALSYIKMIIIKSDLTINLM